MTYPLVQELVGKRIRLIEMKDDPMPVESGTCGTIYHFGGDVLNVEWDNGRNVGVIIGYDIYEIIDNENKD